VGAIEYIPAREDKDPVYNFSYPSHFFIELRIPENQFNDLVSNFRIGKLPSSFNVKVRGMSLPTEFEYRWDVKEFPALPIIYFGASFVAAVDYSISKESKPFKQTLEPSNYPPTRADFDNLLRIIEKKSEHLETLAAKMTWSVGGIILIAAVLAWRTILK
jgi:hypothetical protein